jgi:hypothetical protein
MTGYIHHPFSENRHTKLCLKQSFSKCFCHKHFKKPFLQQCQTKNRLFQGGEEDNN